MIGRAIVLYLTFASALSAVAVADQTADGSVDEGLKSLFGRAVAEEVLQIDDLFSFDVANEYLCVLRKPDGDESSIFEVYNIFTREKLWSVQRPARNYRINRGPRPSVVLYHYIPYERVNLWVYDLSGEHLFDIPESRGGVRGAPSGSYFIWQKDWRFSGASILDRHGQELWSGGVPGADFEAFAFDDSVVVFTSQENILFIDVPSGRLLDSLPPIEPWVGRPGLVAGPFASQALLSWPRNDLASLGFLYDSNLEIIWEGELRCREAAFSRDGRYLATLEGDVRDTLWLALYRSDDGEELWRLPYPFAGDSIGGAALQIRFADDLIVVPTDWPAFVLYGRSYKPEGTFLVAFNPATGELGATAAVDELLAVSSKGDRVVVARPRLKGQSNRITIQEWGHESKE